MLRHYLRALAAFAVIFVAGVSPAADGLPDDVASTSYFPVLPFDAPPGTTPQFIPVAVNHPIDQTHNGLDHAVIIIHDFTRDARGSMATIAGLAGGDNANTMIVAPQFLIDFDVTRFADKLPDRGRMFVRWPLGGWENGGDSIRQPPAKAISTFTVLDLLLIYLSDPKYFPDMRQITVAGHGAGGDFVQRYAAIGRAPDLLTEQGLNIRFLVADPSSYLYFTERRPKQGKSLFLIPDDKNCPTYDNYPYGLSKPNDYLRRAGESAVRLGYSARSVTYLAGEKAAASDPLPDTSCAAMLQGPDRVARTANYKNYLEKSFGEAAAEHHQFFMISRTGYDPADLFGTDCGMSVLFGDGNCAAPHIRGSGSSQ